MQIFLQSPPLFRPTNTQKNDNAGPFKCVEEGVWCQLFLSGKRREREREREEKVGECEEKSHMCDMTYSHM